MGKRQIKLSIIALFIFAFGFALYKYKSLPHSKETEEVFKVHVTKFVVRNPAYQDAMKFVREVLSKAGYERIEFVEHDNRTGLNLVNTGELDASLGVSASFLKNYPDLIPATFPYLILEYSVMTPKGRKWDLNDLKKMNGVINQDNLILREILEYPDLKISVVSGLPDVFRHLLGEHADYTIFPKADGMMNSPVFQKFEITEEVLITEPFYFVVAKKRATDAKTIEASFKSRLKEDLSGYPTLKGILNTEIKTAF